MDGCLKKLGPHTPSRQGVTQAVYEKLIRKTYTFRNPRQPTGDGRIAPALAGLSKHPPRAWKVSRTTNAFTSSGYKTTLEAMLDADYKRQFEEEKKD